MRFAGARVLALGGSWSNGTPDGPFYWNANDSSGNASLTYGGRLIAANSLQDLAPHLPYRSVEIS